MKQLDGRTVAKAVKESLSSEVSALKSKHQRPPGLAVVLVGDDPASQVYVKNKIKSCLEVGIESFEYRLPADTNMKDLSTLLEKLNQDQKVDGILVQLPLPSHLDSDAVIQLIDLNKDVDGLTDQSAGLLTHGKAIVKPCTPAGVMEILKHYDIDVAGKQAVVIGRSNIVGKPMAALLLEANATVTICHSQTKNLHEYTKNADLIVVAAGRPEFLGADDFSMEAVVIDVGMHRKQDGKLCGDVKTQGLYVSAITPVPGGVGPMTIAMLMKNTVELFKIHEESK